jgi:hypothetical protein
MDTKRWWVGFDAAGQLRGPFSRQELEALGTQYDLRDSSLWTEGMSAPLPLRKLLHAADEKGRTTSASGSSPGPGAAGSLSPGKAPVTRPGKPAGSKIPFTGNPSPEPSLSAEAEVLKNYPWLRSWAQQVRSFAEKFRLFLHPLSTMPGL